MAAPKPEDDPGRRSGRREGPGVERLLDRYGLLGAVLAGGVVLGQISPDLPKQILTQYGTLPTLLGLVLVVVLVGLGQAVWWLVRENRRVTEERLDEMREIQEARVREAREQALVLLDHARETRGLMDRAVAALDRAGHGLTGGDRDASDGH